MGRVLPTNQMTELDEPKQTKAPAKGMTELAVTGMTCGNCARHVMEAIQTVPGVQSANVSLDAHQAAVRWQAGTEPNVEAVIKAVEQEGYGAKVVAAQTCDHGEDKLAGWQVNLLLGVPATLALMLGEWAFGLAMARWFQWFSFGLAGLVQVFAGARFYRGAWSQLKVGSSNMDTLVALGSTTAFAYSAWALLSGHPGHVYFMEASAIITLISVGHWMESLVSGRASSALQKLLNLAPALARRRQPDGSEREVPVSELEGGPSIGVRPGDRVPTDGAVEEGESAVDESMLTGESLPIDKRASSPLYAGTVNLNGRLVMRVMATGEETALAHIIAAVQRAQNSRANIQRLGDRVSSVFVPIVVATALAAGLWWGLAPASANLVHNWLAQFAWVSQPPETPLAAGFIIAAAVLIIACPCAMGLATPVAIMAGANAAAQRGILIRDGVALEKAGQVTAVVFDKTGTLTVGKPSVVKVWESEARNPKAEGRNKSEGAKSEDQGFETGRMPVLQLAGALARNSSHPISQAIAGMSSADLALTDWQEVHGAGVQGKVGSPKSKVQSPKSEVQDAGLEAVVRLGSLRWLRESAVDLAAGPDFIEEWATRGATIVGLAE